VNSRFLICELDTSAAERAGEILRLAYQQIYPTGTRDDYIAHVVQVGERLAKAIVLGCFLDRELAGSATLVLEEGSEFAEWLNDSEAGLRMLGVDPQFQRLGVAKALVGECLMRAVECDKRALVLHTEKQMVAAQHLYESMGFSRVPYRDFSLAEVELLCYRRELIG
jgi:ribosomal protein S18 acetylase RimI-like enzyme